MNCLSIQKMNSHPILFLSFTGRISSSGFVKASKCPGISGREIAMICMSKKLVSELLWDDDTWCSSHPVGDSKEKVTQHSQLAFMDRAQVVLETTEGEGPQPQGNGRIRMKSTLSRGKHHLNAARRDATCHGTVQPGKANPTVGCHNLKAPFQIDTTLGTRWR